MTDQGVTLAFVGDISFADFLFCQGFGVRTMAKEKGGDFFFEKVKSLLQSNDLLFGNIEAVLSRSGENKKLLESVDMRGDPECALALKKTGFSVLNIANNHAMQHGVKPFWDTVSLLESLDIQLIGIHDTGRYHCRPVVLNKNGYEIGFLGYAFETDKYFTGKLPYATGEDELILKDIERLRKKVDILVVSNHWGIEFMDRPSVGNIRLARRMVDYGADIIVGHHPHVVQGVETYKNKIIAYSLGNFLFDMKWRDTYRKSFILKIDCSTDMKFSFSTVPLKINDYYQPVPLVGIEKKTMIDEIKGLSKKIQQELSNDTEMNALGYYNEYKEKVKKERWSSYSYFASNLFRFKKKYLLQQIKKTINSRLEDLNISFKLK